ncbi:unnamed protein product [Oikopleura dioica]|uniref:Protein SSUH2 homolog n=1 Tax=Oikopleura dioica TaxID=34765 RepID=E4YFQ9_OIKDI|nr:unnamed protein product [Oikopleura dioica]
MSVPPYPGPGAGYNPGYPVPQNNPVPESEKFIPENPEHNHDPSHLPHDAELPSYDWATNMTPPSAPLAGEIQNPDASQWEEKLHMDENLAIQCLEDYIDENCCWGKGPLKKMKVISVEPSMAFKYRLTSLTEKRNTEWAHEPYHWGSFVDGPENGPQPDPWSIEIPRPVLKKPEDETSEDKVEWEGNGKEKRKIPHTEHVKICWHCHGRGRVRCTHCHGSGESGVGDNKRRCGICHGSGRKRCHTCHGTGRLKHFLMLIVKFETEKDHFIHEETDLPDEEIMKATGTCLFQESNVAVGWIQNFRVASVNDNSAKLVHEHRTKWPDRRVWSQAHQLDSVPVYEIRYKKNEKEGRYWIMGNNELIWSEDYPAQCCCCLNFKDGGCCNNCACCNKCSCTVM